MVRPKHPMAANDGCTLCAEGCLQHHGLGSQCHAAGGEGAISEPGKDAQQRSLKLRLTLFLLARQYHPDLNTDRSASIKMAELTSAYDTLMDPKRRAALDQATAGAYAGAQSYTGGFPNFNNDEWVSPSQMYSEYADLFGRNSQFRTQSDASAATRGEDVSTSVELEFMEAAKGCEKVVSLRLKQVCVDCRGSGAKEGTTWSKCRVCKGTGVHRQEKGIFSMGLPCHRCRGSGMVLDHPCRSCKGESVKMMPRDLRVTVPPGVRSMMELRVPGAGHAGSRGGKAGHLFVQVKVLPHERFRLVEDFLSTLPSRKPSYSCHNHGHMETWKQI